ncbi:hypothetical protein EXIGLDRAFT_622439, partial [Exidia glandulosa HHB12029]
MRQQLSLSNDGLPSRAQYDKIVDEYYANLTPRKHDKALIDAATMTDVLLALHNPGAKDIRTAQFRFWVRKMFKLDEFAGREQVIHEERVVAVKENIYDIICSSHRAVQHAGRDRTNANIRKHYSWIPKEIVAGFVKACPTCNLKRT